MTKAELRRRLTVGTKIQCVSFYGSNPPPKMVPVATVTGVFSWGVEVDRGFGPSRLSLQNTKIEETPGGFDIILDEGTRTEGTLSYQWRNQ